MKTLRSADVAYQCFGNIELTHNHDRILYPVVQAPRAQRHASFIGWVQSTVVWQEEGDLTSSGDTDKERAT